MPADDLVLNVRQIASYSNQGVQPTDNLLLQRGGLGGPYLTATAQQIVSTALNEGGPLGVDWVPPADSGAAEVYAGHYITAINGGSGYNAYNTAEGFKYLSSGPAATLTFGPAGGWIFQVAEPGSAGALLGPMDQIFSLTADGAAHLLLGTLNVARDPIAPLEVATAQFVAGQVAALAAATVSSFNGRRGDVCLWIQDILNAGGAPQFSPVFGGQPRAPTPPLNSCNSRIATTAFCQQVLIGGVNHLLADHPFVFTFNGRTGNVVLTAADLQAVEGLLDSPVLTGNPTAPTPPPGDSSASISTTQFVTAAISSAIAALDASIAGLYAPIVSPALSGYPTAPTQAPGTSDATLATTAFVHAAVVDSTTGVATFNGRTGAVILESTDLTTAGGALLVSPAFTGTPSAPTAPVGSTSTQIANCAWVMQEIGGSSVGVMSFNGRGGAVTLLQSDITGAGGATLFSPVFSGNPTAPTMPTGDNSSALATTAFVMSELGAQAGVSSFNGRTGVVTLAANDISAASGIINPSPTLLGVPLAPTASQGTNTNQIATTAFVAAALAGVGGVASWNGRTGVVTLTQADVNAPSVGGPYAAVTNLSSTNRIINGNMQFDQRNSGAAGTAVSVYTIDRWSYNATQTGRIQWQRTTLGPAGQALGFGYSISLTSLSAYTPLASDAFAFQQIVEAGMITDFAWGTPGAQQVTLSFWITSSLTGTFSGVITNMPTPPTRSYPFTFNIPTANTWTKIVITIPGDTGGPWVLQGSLGGLILFFDLGSGATYRAPAGAWAAGNYRGVTGANSLVATNAATLNITNVKLEIGSVATPYPLETTAKRFMDCQRYYQTGQLYSVDAASANAGAAIAISSLCPVTMRANATLTQTGGAVGNISGLVIGHNGSMFSAAGTATAVGTTSFNISFAASAEL